MSISNRMRSDCRLCGSQRLELAVPIRPCPIGDAYVSKDQINSIQDIYPMDLYLCMECSHLQLLYVVDPSILFSNYTYETSHSPGLVNHFNKYSRDVLAKVRLKKDSLVVEIGSNDGTLLSFFKATGLNVLGIDPAKAIAQKSCEKGVETWPTFFNEEIAQQILNKKGQASLVCANNVFAHADDMMGIAKGISQILSKDGVFVFEVSYIVDLVKKNVFDTIYHEHLCHHSIKPLETFLQRFGMTLFDIERNESKGGSIRCYAQRIDGSRIKSSCIQEYLDLEYRLGFHTLKVYSEFSQRLEKLRDDLHLLLSSLRNKGKKIAGYGASNPITTIIFHLELGSHLSCLYDDNPLKQQMFSPGIHLPVVPSEEIYNDKPDYIVVLAWAYLDRIREKHSRYLTDLNGRFITPIPEMRIIG